MLLQISNSRPASASIVRLSRPSLFAAAARVTKEQERQDEGQTVGKTATRAKLQLVLRHTPQLRAVLKGLPHLHSGHSLSGGDVLLQGEGGGSMAPIALEGWAQALTHEIATFDGKPMVFQLRDMGLAALEHKATLDQLVNQGRTLLQVNSIVAAGSSSDGAAAAAAWLQALTCDDCELVERCVSAMPVLVTMQDGSSCSALHVAAASGSSNVLLALLSRGAPLWSRDCWGRLPVHTLCVGAAMSEFALRRQQAKTAFVCAFVGLELDGRIPCNDDATRIMAGQGNASAWESNCWLSCMERILQYSGRRGAEVAVTRDDKGFSCAQYAAAEDSVMQLGILRLLLQRASEGDGWGTVTSLHEHKQQLECTARCLGHQAAFEFVREFLGRNEENGNGDAFDQAAQLQGTSVLTVLQQMLLRSAAALKPTLGQPKEENGGRPNHLKAKEPLSPALSPPSDPREDMVKFRQLGPSLPVDAPWRFALLQLLLLLALPTKSSISVIIIIINIIIIIIVIIIVIIIIIIITTTTTTTTTIILIPILIIIIIITILIIFSIVNVILGSTTLYRRDAVQLRSQGVDNAADHIAHFPPAAVDGGDGRLRSRVMLLSTAERKGKNN